MKNILIGLIIGIMIGFVLTYSLRGHYDFHVVKGAYGNAYLYKVNTLTGKIWWSTPEVHGVWLESQENPHPIQSNLTLATPAPKTQKESILNPGDITKIAPTRSPVKEKPKEAPINFEELKPIEKKPFHKINK